MEKINILLRTHNRPQLFSRCLESITSQNYPNLRVVVGYDIEVDYIPNWCKKVFVSANKELPYFYDCYLNDLKELVTEGYYFILDDDDYLLPNVLNQIVFDAPAIIHKLDHLGKLIPPENNLSFGLIGMPCFMLHHSLKNLADFSGGDHGDWHYIKAIEKQVPLVFRDLVLVKSDVKGNGI